MSASSAMLHCWNNNDDDDDDDDDIVKPTIKSVGAKHMRISLCHKTSPVCIQIVGAKYLIKFDALLVCLFDGSAHKNAFVDKSMWQCLADVQRTRNVESDNKDCHHVNNNNNDDDDDDPSTSIRVGSIVILYEYVFEATHSFVSQRATINNRITALDFVECVSQAFVGTLRNDAQSRDDTSVLKLLKFGIIGHDQNLAYYSAQQQRDLSRQSNKDQTTTTSTTVSSLSNPVSSASTSSESSSSNTFSSYNIVDTCGWRVSSHVVNKNKKPVPIALLASLPINSTDWTIKASVFRVGVLKSFTNRTTGESGQLQRILLMDDSGLVEAIAYNKAITMLNLSNLKRDQTYFVYNAKLGVSPRSLQEWFALFQTSAVEIKLFGSTKIVDSSLVNDNNDDDDKTNKKASTTSGFVPKPASSQGRDDDDDDDDDDDTLFLKDDDTAGFLQRQLHKLPHVPDVELTSRLYVDSRIAAANLNENQPTSSTISNNNSAKKQGEPRQTTAGALVYTKLKYIKDHLQTNATVNTMGVLTSLGTCETTFVVASRCSLKIRRIVLLDETQTKMTVALWGEQAQNFTIPLESIVLVQDAKVTYFNGALLSIYRKSSLLEYNHIFNNKDAEILQQWYENFTGKSNRPEI